MGYSFTFRFSEKDIDFSPQTERYFNYSNFVLNEFFNSTDAEMLVIMTAYKNEYGQSSFNYVVKNYYHAWRRGDRSLSNVQRDRILYIMRSLLNESAKKRLASIKEEARFKLGIEEILGAIKRTVELFQREQVTLYVKEKEINVADLIDTFQVELERVKKLTIPEHTSRYGRNNIIILTQEEKDEALQIAQYICYIKLQILFDQIEKDFNTFLPFMNCFKRGIFKAYYSINYFHVKMDITKAKSEEIKIPKFLISEIEANSRFKEYSDKYLAYELVNIKSDSSKAVTTGFLNTNDLKMFFEHYEELSNSDSEVNIKSSFNGEGGVLNIHGAMKPIKMLKTSISISAVKILIFTIIFVGLLSWGCYYEWWTLLVIGGLVVGGVYISLVIEEFKQIKSYKTDIKIYG